MHWRGEKGGGQGRDGRSREEGCRLVFVLQLCLSYVQDTEQNRILKHSGYYLALKMRRKNERWRAGKRWREGEAFHVLGREPPAMG